MVRHALAAGLPVPDVAAAASTTPARVLGIGDRTGALHPGLAADLVVCGDDFRPRAVMRQGRWLAPTAVTTVFQLVRSVMNTNSRPGRSAASRTSSTR